MNKNNKKMIEFEFYVMLLKTCKYRDLIKNILKKENMT